uniref:Disease resistance protein At4g27190-like leucine-rich repeats domain-containing protein n=1 Tax=Oryza glumipatula TaxID=40148 RepID=A0A0D9Y9R7_9ORYZ
MDPPADAADTVVAVDTAVGRAPPDLEGGEGAVAERDGRPSRPMGRGRGGGTAVAAVSAAPAFPAPCGRDVRERGRGSGASGWERGGEGKRHRWKVEGRGGVGRGKRPAVRGGMGDGEPIGGWGGLGMLQCHVTRCLKMHMVFFCDDDWRYGDFFVSQLVQARCIWSRGLRFWEPNARTTPAAFSKLRCIHLHSCPRLRHVLHWSFPTMESLETIHITYCGELTQIFPKPDICSTERTEFPSLRRIHLQDLPMLQDICETAMETIKLRGCWSIKRLTPSTPAVHAISLWRWSTARRTYGRSWSGMATAWKRAAVSSARDTHATTRRTCPGDQSSDAPFPNIKGPLAAPASASGDS